MLASLIANNVTGTYNFTHISLTLPTPLVRSLLPEGWSFLSSNDLERAGLSIPPAPEGRNWVVVQAGEQRGTGMSLPGGRSTFYEAKLEIPFLRHPASTSVQPTPTTYKHTLLFSSLMMSLSSSSLTGLRSHKVAFELSGGFYEAQSYLSVNESKGEPADEAWTEEQVRRSIGAWWAGERTGDVAIKFLMTDRSPPSFRPHLTLRLHLPSFTHTSVEEVRELMAGQTGFGDDGWLEVACSGWQLDEGTTMEIQKATQL